MTSQSLRSEKNSGLDPGPHSRQNSFQLPTLTGHSFAAPWVTMIKSGSFESPKPYLLIHNFKNSRIPLWTSIRTSWKVTIYYIKGVLMILNRIPLYVYFSMLRVFNTNKKTINKAFAGWKRGSENILHIMDWRAKNSPATCKLGQILQNWLFIPAGGFYALQSRITQGLSDVISKTGNILV